ncbi:hypothetical protein FOCC_FOCC006147, partial [Frankliniella occidentalis]
ESVTSTLNEIFTSSTNKFFSLIPKDFFCNLIYKNYMHRSEVIRREIIPKLWESEIAQLITSLACSLHHCLPSSSCSLLTFGSCRLANRFSLIFFFQNVFKSRTGWQKNG